MKISKITREVRIVLIVLGAVSVIGIASRYIWWPKDSNKNIYVAECSTTIQAANVEPFKLPSYWSWNEIKDIGVKYAYPKSWGNPTTLTNSGAQKYETSFTVSSSGANIMVSLNPDCSDFKSAISDITNDKYNTPNGSTTTKAIRLDRSSFSLLSHWSSDAGNQYKLTTYDVVNIGSIKTAAIDYSIIAGAKQCPDDRLASFNQPKCINQIINDEVNKVIGSLKKM